MKTSTKILALLAVSLAITSVPTNVRAADYPSKPLNVIITGNAGGGMDTMVRTLQPYLEKIMGISLVPMNVYSGSRMLIWTC